jgi:hypothetical protein
VGIRCGDSAETTRQEVRARWTDLIQGRRSRLQVARWAEHRLDDSAVGEEELVTQALLFLQAVDLTHDGTQDEPAFRHAQSEPAAFVTSDADVVSAFAAWIEQLRRYDLNPDAWNSAYFLRLIADFAARLGTEPAWRFADKLVASRKLKVVDVENLLGRRPPASGLGLIPNA